MIMRIGEPEDLDVGVKAVLNPSQGRPTQEPKYQSLLHG
jgi:hypothetical protein